MLNPGKDRLLCGQNLKTLRHGRVIDNTFSSGTKVNLARVERRPYQYLYKDDMGYYFMHLETFEQIHVEESLIENHEFLLEGASVEIVVHADTETILSVDIPQFVVMEVIYSEPGLRGDTANNTLKQAKVQNGATIMVPLFVNTGDKIRIDTRDKTYVERVKGLKVLWKIKKAPTDRLKISKFKLDSLLDITLSINANLPTEDLLSKYEYILRNNLGIGKILIFKRSDTWECLLNGGFPKHFETIDVESRLLGIYRDYFSVLRILGFEGVDIIVPVYNNNVHLAFVFIGDIEEEGEGMSPVLKHLNFIQTISSIIIVAIENIRLFKESLRQEALKKELELAARMQKMLIPDNSHMPKNPKMIVNGFYYPSL